MKLIALVSAAGGSGRSTLTAQLAGIFVQRGHNVLALDLDPANGLGLHLGLPLAERDGWARRTLAGAPWREAAFRNSDGVLLLPHGRFDESEAARRPTPADGAALRRQLEALGLPADTLVLIDTPRLPATAALAALRTADLALHLLRADAGAYAALEGGGATTRYVVNQFEAMQPLQADIMQLLRRELGDRLAPTPVHRDGALPEATAANLGLADHAPHSQAAHDLQGLASWLLQQPGLRA